MPWSETCPMDQRRKFIEDWIHDDWSVSDLCRAYGISRKTGYKWLERFKTGGICDLDDQSRAHRAHPSTTVAPIEAQIVQLRHSHPFWGPRKLKRRLQKLRPDQGWPASSTIGAILKRHGLVMPRRRRYRTPGYVGPLTKGLTPNDVWAADFKGWFKTTDGTRVDPLTVSDSASRYLIRCRAVAQTNGDNVKAQFTSAFQEFGMPKVLRTDNGVPFATVGLGGLSDLSVWLIRLGITPERIRPGQPQENGAHERMHKTMKQETANPPRANLIDQQRAFDRFLREYNEIRPHEALGMETPADFYVASSRPFPRKLPEVEYVTGSTIRLVTTNGTIKFKDKRIYLSNALIDERVRIDESNGSWDVWYGPVLLGELDLKREMINRRPTKVLPMIPV
jgi:transposase InsO family protein